MEFQSGWIDGYVPGVCVGVVIFVRLPGAFDGRASMGLGIDGGLAKIKGVEKSSMVDCDGAISAMGDANVGTEGVLDFADAGVQMNGCHSRVRICG